MNFFFCEKCNKRITDAELESGVALDKKAKGVYCKQCSVGVKTTEFAAITDEQIKPHVVQPPTAEIKRASANSIAAVPRRPSSGERHAPSSAERHSSIKMAAAPQRNKPNTPDSKSASIGMIVGAIGGVTILIFLLAGPGKPKEHKPEFAVAPLPAPSPPSPPPPVTPTPKANLEASNPSHIQPAPPKTAQPPVETKPPEAPPENFVTSAPVITVPSPPVAPVETAPKATLPPVVETPAKEKAPPAEPEKAQPLIAVDMKSPAIVYAEFHDDLLTALRGGDAQLATQRVTQAEQNALLKPLEKEIAQDRAILKWYSDLDKALLRGIDKLREIDNFELRPQVGAPIQVGKRAIFQLSTVNDGKIEVGAQGVSMTISIDKLQPVTRNKLQAMGFADDGSGVLRRAFIQVLAAGSEPSAILTVPAMLEKARKAGAAEDEAATLERLLKSAEAPARELAASMTWDEINKAVQDKQYPRIALLPSICDGKFIAKQTKVYAFNVESGAIDWQRPGAGGYCSLIAAYSGADGVVMDVGTVLNAKSGEVYGGITGQFPWNTIASPALINGNSFGNAGPNGTFKIVDPGTKGTTIDIPMGFTSTGGGDWAGGLISSPVAHEGYIYMVTEGGVLIVLDLKTKQSCYHKQLDTRSRFAYVSMPGSVGSPAIAGKYLYVMDDYCTTFVLETGPKFKQVSRNVLHQLEPNWADACGQQGTMSTAIFDENRMYVRCGSALWCVGEK